MRVCGRSLEPVRNFRLACASPGFVLPPLGLRKRWGIGFEGAGGLPALRDLHLFALVVTIPMAAITQADEIDLAKLIVLRQRQVWPLPKRVDMVDS